jgi:hypothetical protein
VHNPPRILGGVALVWFVVLLVQSSDAGVGLLAVYTWLFGGAAIAVAWVIRLILFRVRRSGTDRRLSRWFAVPPVLILSSLAIGLVEAPRSPLFRIRFALSERALTREARALLASGDRRETSSRRIGLFTIERLTVAEGQVRFITTSCGVVDSCGMVYSPTAQPVRWMEDQFTPLSNGWWHVYEGF